MAEGKQFTCMCGWTVISPNGEEDVLKHVEMHAKEHHPDMRLSKDDLRSSIKTVDMPMAK